MTIKEFKPEIKIISYNDKVGLENLQLTDTILPKITGIINATNNITSRKFMDEQCFKYSLPLFDSGICGTSCNLQPIIPFVTETYSTSNDPEQEISYPLCVITSFPNEINHTIFWAIEKFDF
jgi:ubiquitin-activating enzyme E1